MTHGFGSCLGLNRLGVEPKTDFTLISQSPGYTSFFGDVVISPISISSAQRQQFIHWEKWVSSGSDLVGADYAILLLLSASVSMFL